MNLDDLHEFLKIILEDGVEAWKTFNLYVKIEK